MSSTGKRDVKLRPSVPPTEVDGCLPQSRLKPTADKPSSDGFVHQPLPSANGSRRLFRFGPGLFLAVLASIAIWAFMPREQSRPVIPSSASSATAAVASAPDPHWLLRRSHALGLAPAQRLRLRRLVDQWDRDTTGLRRELNDAASDLNSQIPNRPQSKVSTPQLLQVAAPMVAMSGQLADARRAWWADARKALTPEQAAAAEADWTNQWVRRGTVGKEAR